MTVAATTRKAGPYNGDGGNVTFAFSFKIFATTDVVVTKTDAAGAETVKAITVDYTVAMNADQNVSPGGSITMLAAPAVGEKITLSSSVPESQGTSLPTGSNYAAKVVETALDRATVLVAQLRELLGRTLTYAISDTSTAKSLPTKTQRANMYLGFDVNGDPVAASAPTGGTVSAAMAPVVSAATTDAGLTQLGFSTYVKTLIGAATAAALRVLFTPLTTKGDSWVYGASDTRLPVGTDFQIKRADSTQATGLKWDWPAAAPAVGRNIAAKNNAATPNTKLDISADALVVRDANGGAMVLTNTVVTIDFGVVGANGIDAGAQAINTWYYGWVIAKPDGTVAGLGSTSSSAPTMPNGYTFKALVTAARSNGSTQFNKYRQFGNRGKYENLQQVVSGGTATTETTVSVSGNIPPIALTMEVLARAQLGRSNTATANIDLYLRVVTGVTYSFSTVGQTSDGVSSYSASLNTIHPELPNIGNSFIYLFSAGTGSPAADIYITGFTLPVGGQ